MNNQYQSELPGLSQYCSGSSWSTTCKDACCCYDSYNNPYCCDCYTFPIVFMILLILGFLIFVILAIVGVRKFIANRRNLRQNILAYHPVSNQPIHNPHNIIYQPNLIANPPNYAYGNGQQTSNPFQYGQANQGQSYQQPNAYLQGNRFDMIENKESLYMG